MTVDLGRFGLWQRSDLLDAELARVAEEAGYGAVWIGGSPSGDLQDAERLLAATERIVVATGIVNMWADDPASVGQATLRLAERFPGRFLLGVGVGHREHTDDYQKPYDRVVSYLDGLDRVGVPREQVVLAALGPKVLRLSRDRTAGAHPYLTVPQHTREAREILGDGPLLAPEHKAVLETDPAAARALTRPAVRPYLGLDNYVRNLRRLDYTEADVTGEGSDRLVDDLALRGDAATVAARLTEHLDAGADHVTVQLLGDNLAADYRTLASVLFA